MGKEAKPKAQKRFDMKKKFTKNKKLAQG